MVSRFAARVILLAGLWWVLTRDQWQSWLLGGPIILSVACWRLRAAGPRLAVPRLAGLARFVPYYVWHSLRGGCDVAWRAVHWRLPIDPSVQTYRFRLPAVGPARLFFANAVSLLPGTLSATWDRDLLQVHVLSERQRALHDLRQLEDRVAALFGHELPPPRGDAGK